MVMQEAVVIENNGEIDDRKQLFGFVKKIELPIGGWSVYGMVSNAGGVCFV